ncbi:hypothetical protein ACFQVC_06295 [Streptomyces monticola]|uniref:Uncharacterized protein n=1 Tax=Streptomyces monticola TaxID=2666263 RepID=A0ABW2JDS3_9ACTN
MADTRPADTARPAHPERTYSADPPPDPVPRDLPEQQAGLDEDPWEGDTERAEERADEETDDDTRDVPDTDEGGTARRQDTDGTGTEESPA